MVTKLDHEGIDVLLAGRSLKISFRSSWNPMNRLRLCLCICRRFMQSFRIKIDEEPSALCCSISVQCMADTWRALLIPETFGKRLSLSTYNMHIPLESILRISIKSSTYCNSHWIHHTLLQPFDLVRPPPDLPRPRAAPNDISAGTRRRPAALGGTTRRRGHRT